jgi:nucleoside-diphosphate-sugar epimerase
VAIMGEFVIAHPHRNVMLNIGGLLNILEIARVFNIKKVLYTSTGAVYGPDEGVVSGVQGLVLAHFERAP